MSTAFAKRNFDLHPLTLAVITIMLSACGGGGGSKEAPVVPVVVAPVITPTPVAPVPAPPVVQPPVAPPININDPQPWNQTGARAHLDDTGVTQAQSKGFSGQGVKIGVVDSGVNLTNPTLIGKIAGEISTTSSSYTTSKDLRGHGTIVSEIISGSHIGIFQGGVAQNAQLYISRSLSEEKSITAPNVAVDWMNSQGVNIINNSWNANYFAERGSNAVVPSTEFFVGAAQSFVRNNGIMVFASGNYSGMMSGPGDPLKEPGVFSVLPHIYKDLEAGWLSVSALAANSTTELAGNSMPCGGAMNWCLVAPGTVWHLAPASNQGDTSYLYTSAQGTSFAAPQVSAAAALVWEAFPWMSNDQVRKTLLSTATDLGAPGVDEVFGYGLLNAGKAVDGISSLEWGDEVFNVKNGASTFSNSISGSGGLIKDGAGTLWLNGVNSYTGGTDVRHGVLGLSGLTYSDVTVGANGVLNINATLHGNISNMGRVVAVSDSSVINGDWVQSDTSVVEIALGAPVKVNGQFKADGELLVSKIANGFVVNGAHNLIDASSVVGAFDVFNVAPSLLLTGTLSYTPTSVVGTFQQTALSSIGAFNATPASSSSSALGDRAFAVGNALIQNPVESPTTTAFFNDLLRLQSVDDYALGLAALEELSGQQHALLAAGVIETQNQADQQNRARLRAVTGANPGFWVAGSSFNNSFIRSGWNGVDSSMSDWTAGFDMPVGYNSVIGVQYTDGRIDSTIDGRLGRAKIDSRGGGLYAKTHFGSSNEWTLAASSVLTSGTSRSTRQVGAFVNAYAEGRQTFNQSSTTVELSREIIAKTDRVHTQIFGALGYQTFDWNALSETNAPLGLLVDGTKTHTTFVELGADVKGVFATDGAWNWAWTARGSLAQTVSSPSLDMNAAFAVDANTRFIIDAPTLPKTRFNYGLGVEGTSGAWGVFLQGNGVYSKDSRGVGATGGVKYAW